jgi:hypothetical protein
MPGQNFIGNTLRGEILPNLEIGTPRGVPEFRGEDDFVSPVPALLSSRGYPDDPTGKVAHDVILRLNLDGRILTDKRLAVDIGIVRSETNPECVEGTERFSSRQIEHPPCIAQRGVRSNDTAHDQHLKR